MLVCTFHTEDHCRPHGINSWCSCRKNLPLLHIANTRGTEPHCPCDVLGTGSHVLGTEGGCCSSWVVRCTWNTEARFPFAQSLHKNEICSHCARSTGPVKWFLQYANEQLVHPQHTVPSAVPKVLRLPQRVPEDIDNVALAIQHFASCWIVSVKRLHFRLEFFWYQLWFQ